MKKNRALKTLGIILARGGSKRLPKKNIKLLAGKPLIAYTIEAASRAANLDRLVLSTDDFRIKRIAERYGVQVPFMRPSFLAMDKTPDHPVLIHALRWLKKNEGYEPDMVVILRPTSPFKTPEMINKVINLLGTNPSLTSMRTVCRAEGVFHPYWAFKKNRGLLRPFIKGISITRYYQRQLLPECYRITGTVDTVRPDNVLRNGDLYGKRVGFLEIDERQAIDIDTRSSFELCEYLMKKRKKK